MLAIIIVVILIVVGVGIYILTRPAGTTNNGTPVKIFDGNPTDQQRWPSPHSYVKSDSKWKPSIVQLERHERKRAIYVYL